MLNKKKQAKMLLYWISAYTQRRHNMASYFVYIVSANEESSKTSQSRVVCIYEQSTIRLITLKDQNSLLYNIHYFHLLFPNLHI